MHRLLKGALILALCGTMPVMAHAQSASPPTVDQQIKTQLGELMFANSLLLTQVQNLSIENARLKAQLEELSKKTAPDKQGN